MSNHDTSYIKAERAYRAAHIREQIIGRRIAARLRKQARARKDAATWES